MQIAAIVAAGIVFCIGLYGILTKRDLFRLCISVSVMESSLIMILVAVAYKEHATAPILHADFEQYVNPLPHALALTAIVIGAGILALALALTILVHQHWGTTDLVEILARNEGKRLEQVQEKK